MVTAILNHIDTNGASNDRTGRSTASMKPLAEAPEASVASRTTDSRAYSRPAATGLYRTNQTHNQTTAHSAADQVRGPPDLGYRTTLAMPILSGPILFAVWPVSVTQSSSDA